ncbi:unnamed protein product [Prorocentrum cordatum]|uniref:Uncharacterized protein n=1 Tax=Prorocentrum cordatum TaxID=2364126 RepID=A0ABN9U726_9DINO|nr:unnamed protein product [Polarella glacialis]
MPHVRSASARIMRRALAAQNGYCVHSPVRLPLEGLVPPTCLPPPGLERATADLVLDYLLLRDPPVVRCSLEEEEAAITTVSDNLSCRMLQAKYPCAPSANAGVLAADSVFDVGLQTRYNHLEVEQAAVTTPSENFSCSLMREEVGQGFGGDQFSQMMVVCPRVSSVDIGVQASSSTDVADSHCEVGCQTESVVGMEGGASGVLLGKVTVAAEEELEAPSSAESSPNVQSDSDSRALSGASRGCLNRPVTLNEVSNPVRGHRKSSGKGQRYHSSAKPAKSSKGANIRGTVLGKVTEEAEEELEAVSDVTLAVASNPGCKDEEEDNVHIEAVAQMEQEEVAQEDFRVYLEKALNLRIRKYRFVRATATDDVVSTVHVPDFLSEFRDCDEDERGCWIWDAFQTFRDHGSIETVLHDLQQVMDSAAQPSALVKEAKHLYDNFMELCELQTSGELDGLI